MNASMILAAVLLAAASSLGCRASRMENGEKKVQPGQDEKKAQEAAPAESKKPPGIEAALETWKKAGEEAKEKAFRQAESQAEKKVRTRKELAACLPGRIPGWKARGAAGAAKRHAGKVPLPMASRTYSRGEGVVAALTLMDTLKSPEARIGFGTGLALTKKVKSPRQRTVEIGGEPGFVTLRAAGPGSGEKDSTMGALLVSERFLLVLEIESLMDYDEAIRIMSAINIARIKALAAD